MSDLPSILCRHGIFCAPSASFLRPVRLFFASPSASFLPPLGYTSVGMTHWDDSRKTVATRMPRVAIDLAVNMEAEHYKVVEQAAMIHNDTKAQTFAKK
jgi:hypothetical protein